jgi:cytochrome c
MLSRRSSLPGAQRARIRAAKQERNAYGLWAARLKPRPFCAPSSRAARIALGAILGIQGLSGTRAAGPGAQEQAAGKAVNSASIDAEKLIKNSDCASCHAVDRQLVGPAYSAIAKRYAGQAGAEDRLARKIKDGGSGAWGNVPMTPHRNLSDAQLEAMAKWVLAQRAGTPGQPGQTQGAGKTYEYKDKSGKTVKLDFPVFVQGSDHKVTKDIFKGYELYDSYCYRCHGQDATESELAPDLKKSLNQGMDEQGFLSTVMAGREGKGMPAWAGFLDEQEVQQIYRYVKGRSLDLVPVGRPSAEGE